MRVKRTSNASFQLTCPGRETIAKVIGLADNLVLVAIHVYGRQVEGNFAQVVGGVEKGGPLGRARGLLRWLHSG